jgi:hypothetical protein
VLSFHDSSATPQTVQTASPVCGTKDFYRTDNRKILTCRNMRLGPSVLQLAIPQSN